MEETCGELLDPGGSHNEDNQNYYSISILGNGYYKTREKILRF